MDPLLRGDRATVSVTTREVEQAANVRAFLGNAQPTLSVQAGHSPEPSSRPSATTAKSSDNPSIGILPIPTSWTPVCTAQPSTRRWTSS